MYYMLLIHTDPEAAANLSPEEIASVYPRMEAFDREISDAGQNVGSIRLGGEGGCSVQVRNGKTITTDGPFAETREQLGGIYLLDVASEAEARDIAARLPTAMFSTVEVRPVAGVDLRRVVADFARMA